MPQEQPMQDVTFYPIGENCLAHGVLQRHGLTVAATPFSHGRSNIDYVIQMVESRFRDMLMPQYLRHDHRHNQRMVINTSYTCDDGLFDPTVSNSFEFTHHDVINNDKARASYQRKASRVLEALTAHGPACFIYHYRAHPGQDIGRVVEKLNRLQAHFETQAACPVSVAMFTQKTVAHDHDRGVDFHRIGNIHTAVLRTRRLWGGRDMDVFWGRVDDDLFGETFAAFQDAARQDLTRTKRDKAHAVPDPAVRRSFATRLRRLFRR